MIPAILYVRVKSNLDSEEIECRVLDRRSRFLEVDGLIQKIYGRDNETGEMCGIYFFESRDALSAFLETELAKTISSAYEAVEVRPEIYDVLYPLYPERGPIGAKRD